MSVMRSGHSNSLHLRPELINCCSCSSYCSQIFLTTIGRNAFSGVLVTEWVDLDVLWTMSTPCPLSEETHRLLHGASLRDSNKSTINIGMPPLYESAEESGDDGDVEEYQGLHASPMVTRSGSR